MISRRSFIKGLMVGALAAVAPPLVLAESSNKHPWFDPKKQYGDYLEFAEGYFDDESLNHAKKLLCENIKDIIPPQYRKRVVFIANKPNKHCYPGGTLGWKTIPIGGRMPRKRFTLN